MNCNKCIIWPGEIKERKVGVVETNASLPEDVTPWISSLRTYQNNCNKTLCRICFEHPRDQQMLMMAKPNHFTPPHYQKKKQIEYHVIQGSAELFLFTKRGTPEKHIQLYEGDMIKLDSASPRSMLVGESGLVFKEMLTGDFKDNDTNWLFGKDINVFPSNKILSLFKEIMEVE